MNHRQIVADDKTVRSKPTLRMVWRMEDHLARFGGQDVVPLELLVYRRGFMGVDCHVCIVDWPAFISTFDKKRSEGDVLDRWSEFCDSPSVIESGSPIHGPCYDSYGYFLDTYDAYKSIREGLSPRHRDNWDRFFGLLMPSYFHAVREYAAVDVRVPLDIGFECIPEMLQVALNPESVLKLYSEIWCQLDVLEFEKCADEAFEIGSGKSRRRRQEQSLDGECSWEEPYPSLNFRDVQELIVYIRAWAEAVEFAADNKMGIVVCVCI